MKFKLLRQVLRMSKYGILGIIMQCFLYSFLIAKDSIAQKPSIEDIYVSINLENKKLKEVFDQIENQTGFGFVFDARTINKNQSVSYSVSNKSLADLLREIAKKSGLSFKRIDENIHVRKNTLFSQTITEVIDANKVYAIVSGTVLNEEDGEPLPGVSIIVKGTNIGTTTDIEGKYSLEAAIGSILQFSYIGFLTTEIEVTNQTEYNISLSPNIEQLEELVVVGYGQQEKRDVTGAISSVKGKDFENLPVTDATQALQGRAAGVQIVRNGGAPGASGSIRIRGTGTINDAEPLVVIDGFPGGSLSSVNPNDIESIEVLKDASSSAIYGTRAANGVIIVTTKKGAIGEKLKFSLNTYTGTSSAINTVDVLDASSLAELKRERYTNDGIDINPIWQDSQYQTQRTDWQDELLGNGKIRNIDASLRGGGEKSAYGISLGYYDEEGLMNNSYYQRYTFRINSNHNIGSRFKLGQNLQVTSSNGNFLNTTSAQTGVLWSAIRFHPGLPVKYDDGTYSSSQISNEFGDINNPIFTVDNEDDKETRHRILGSVSGELKIFEGLTAKTNFGIDAEIYDRNNFDIIIDNQTRANSRNTLGRNYSEYYSILTEYFLEYKKTFSDIHSINIVGGYTAQTFNSDYFSAQRRDFPDESEYKRYLDAGESITGASGNRSYDALESWFARANYSFKDRYLLTATFRADGSSKFADGNRWGSFPAFSLGWRVSEESFWNIAFIDNLKLTGGWGQLGNQKVPALQYYSLISSGKRYSFGGNEVVGASQRRIPNPDIAWETAEMSNFGLEASFIQGKLFTNINYFLKDTKDMLLPVPSIGSQGNTEVPFRNVGELRNKGWEIELGYRSSVGDFSYNINGNVSFIKNEVTKLNVPFMEAQRYGRPNQEIARTYVGEPIGVFYGWVADGLYQNEAEIASDPSLSNDPRREDGLIQPGDTKFVDLDGNGIIDDEDRTVIGNPHPTMTYGLNANFTYKGFDLSFFFLGEAGKEIYNGDRMQGLDPTYPYNMYAETLNRWNGEGTSNSIPRMTTKRDNLNHRTSTLFIEDGGFMRLKNLTVGYTIPYGLSSKLGVSNARFYITGQNVFTITNYNGIDPELGYINQNNDGNLQIGVDYAQYPQARTWIFGATLDF